jgi:hypothetical protein
MTKTAKQELLADLGKVFQYHVSELTVPEVHEVFANFIANKVHALLPHCSYNEKRSFCSDFMASLFDCLQLIEERKNGAKSKVIGR